MKVDAGEAESWRDQDRPRGAIGAEGFAVEVEEGVEFPGSPAVQDRLRGGDVDAEWIGDWPQVGCQRDDGADIEISVCPTVETPPDARRKRVVDRRMAAGTGDAEVLQAATVVADNSDRADDREVGKQQAGDRRIVEIDTAFSQRPLNRWRQIADIDLDAEPERSVCVVCSSWV